MAKGAFVTELEVQKIRLLIKMKVNKGKTARQLLPIVKRYLNRSISLSTLQRIIAQVHKYDRHDERLEPWSLGSITKYPVPSELIPLLLRYQEECKNRIDPGMRHPVPLTIWESQWLIRLYKLFEHSQASVLDAAVWLCAYEQMWELSQPDAGICDTTPFDAVNGDQIMANIKNFFGPGTESKDMVDTPEVKQQFRRSE